MFANPVKFPFVLLGSMRVGSRMVFSMLKMMAGVVPVQVYCLGPNCSSTLPEYFTLLVSRLHLPAVIVVMLPSSHQNGGLTWWTSHRRSYGKRKGVMS